MAEVQYIPRDVKSVSSILPPEKYIECKTMAGDIIEYWLEKYPDLLKEWGESGIIEDESEDEDEEDEDEDEDEGEDEENEDEEDEEDEEAAIN